MELETQEFKLKRLLSQAYENVGNLKALASRVDEIPALTKHLTLIRAMYHDLETIAKDCDDALKEKQS